MCTGSGSGGGASLVGDPVLDGRQLRDDAPRVADVPRDEHGRHVRRRLRVEPSQRRRIEVDVQSRLLADQRPPLTKKLDRKSTRLNSSHT